MRVEVRTCYNYYINIIIIQIIMILIIFISDTSN